MNYITTLIIIFWLAHYFTAKSETLKKLCGHKDIANIATRQSINHWYFNGYLTKQEINKLERALMQLDCNPAIKLQKRLAINSELTKIMLIGIKA